MPGIKRKVKVKKIPEGPRDPSLSATFRPGKVKGRSRKKLLTGRKLGGTLTSQGYKDRKDESIAMRDPKKRTKKQLKASRDESYGKFGHGTGKGKINKAKAGGVVKKAGGGMTRQGLYPAEEARSGTMSQAKRKRYMKKGGKVSYRNMGGVIGGKMPSNEVVNYLYQFSDKIDY